MDILENSQRSRRFSGSQYQSEKTPSYEKSSIHRQEIPERIPTQTIRHGILEPSHQQTIYRSSLKHLPPVFQRYQQEIYRSREPITREHHSVRPLTTRRLRPFQSGYNTEDYSADEESQFRRSRDRSSLSPERLPLQSIEQENIEPSTQQLEYQQFLQQLPPAFARYQQEIYGPRDPLTDESLGAETRPLTTRPVSTREPYTSTPLPTRRPSPLETRIQSEPEKIVAEGNEGKKRSELDRKIRPIMNTNLIPSARSSISLQYIEEDRQLLIDLGFYVTETIGYGSAGDIYKGVCNEYAFKRYRDESTADPNDPNSGVWNEVSLKGKYFALKFMIFGIEDRENIDEAKYMLEFNHINVVDIYCVISGIIPPSGTHTTPRIKMYIMMEFSELGDIYFFIKRKLGGVLSEILYKDFVRQTIEGLLYIHSKNICHADIKDLNILVFTDERTGDYIIKYSDFGITYRPTDAEEFEVDLQDLCRVWKSLLIFVKNDNEFTQLMREFLKNLAVSSDWVYQTLQSMIDENPWLFE